MHLSLMTPENVFFSAQAEKVTVPGASGEFGVLPGHAPFISTLRPGLVIIETAHGEQRAIAVLGGIAEVAPDHCTLLAEVAQDFSGMTAAEAQSELSAARSEREHAVTEQEIAKTERRLALAQAVSLGVTHLR